MTDALPSAVIPAQVWVLLADLLRPVIMGLGALLFVGLIVVVLVAWRKGRFPSVSSVHQRKTDDALLQIVKENTSAFQALKSMQEDSRNITIAAVGKLEDLGRVLAAMAQKMEDVHTDVRPHQHQLGRRGSGG